MSNFLVQTIVVISFKNRESRNAFYESHAIKLISSVKQTLWIGTADTKDIYVKQGSNSVPLLANIAELIKHGISVRLIHAKEPGPNFRKDFDKFLFYGKEILSIIIFVIRL